MARIVPYLVLATALGLPLTVRGAVTDPFAGLDQADQVTVRIFGPGSMRTALTDDQFEHLSSFKAGPAENLARRKLIELMRADLVSSRVEPDPKVRTRLRDRRIEIIFQHGDQVVRRFFFDEVDPAYAPLKTTAPEVYASYMKVQVGGYSDTDQLTMVHDFSVHLETWAAHKEITSSRWFYPIVSRPDATLPSLLEDGIRTAEWAKAKGQPGVAVEGGGDQILVMDCRVELNGLVSKCEAVQDPLGYASLALGPSGINVGAYAGGALRTEPTTVHLTLKFKDYPRF